MTQVENSIMWREPYLNARRLGPGGPDTEEFIKVIKQRAGINIDEIIAVTDTLPFGYSATKGTG